MYIDVVPNRNSPPAILLRESYRFEGKVHKRALLNISGWAPELIRDFRTFKNTDPDRDIDWEIAWLTGSGDCTYFCVVGAIPGVKRDMVSAVDSTT